MTGHFKENAKRVLAGNWGIAIAVTLIYGVVSGISSQFYGIGTLFVAYPLAVGVNVYFINLFRGKAEFEDLLDPFKRNYIESVFTMFLMQIYVFLWSLLLIIPGIIKAFSYAMVPYIMADKDYDLAYNEAIAESNRMMDGRKMDLFILSLSFIGWALLGVLTFGLLYFWLIPYMNATFAAFYLETKGEGLARRQESIPDEAPVMKDHVEPKQDKEDEWDF